MISRIALGTRTVRLGNELGSGDKKRDRIAAFATHASPYKGMLARAGCRLEERPRGFVITDGEHYAAAAKVDKDASRLRLEQRFGVSYAEYRSLRTSDNDAP